MLDASQRQILTIMLTNGHKMKPVRKPSPIAQSYIDLMFWISLYSCISAVPAMIIFFIIAIFLKSLMYCKIGIAMFFIFLFIAHFANKKRESLEEEKKRIEGLSESDYG